MSRRQLSLFDAKLLGPALIESVLKLDPRVQWRNPVMFVVYVGTAVTAARYVQALSGEGEAPAGFILAIAIWLLFTVLFANFATALAEARGKAQAESLRKTRSETPAYHLGTPSGWRISGHGTSSRPRASTAIESARST